MNKFLGKQFTKSKEREKKQKNLNSLIIITKNESIYKIPQRQVQVQVTSPVKSIKDLRRRRIEHKLFQRLESGQLVSGSQHNLLTKIQWYYEK